QEKEVDNINKAIDGIADSSSIENATYSFDNFAQPATKIQYSQTNPDADSRY
ncbi:unnamed protein product, partial [marine sediment metagenome]